MDNDDADGEISMVSNNKVSPLWRVLLNVMNADDDISMNLTLGSPPGHHGC